MSSSRPDATAMFADRKLLMIIATITLLKAVLFFLVLPNHHQAISAYYGIGFADDYHMLAENIAAGNGFRFTADTAPTLMREPGYPLLLAALFSMFGVSLTAARVVNLIIGIGSAILVANVAHKLTKNAVPARLAASLFMIHPGVVVAEVRGGVESLFILLLLMFFLATLRAFASERLRDYVIAGLVLGVTSLVRGTALLFPPFFIIYFVLWERRHTPFLKMLWRIAITMGAALLVLSPWIARNYLLVQKFAPTASVAGVSAHSGHYSCTHMSFDQQLQVVDAAGAAERLTLAQQQGYRYKRMDDLYYIYFYDVRDEVAFNGFLGKQVFQAYVRSPTLLASCMAKNAFNFWFAGKTWTSTTLNAIAQLPYMLLGLVGFFLAMRGDGARPATLLGLFVAYTMAVYMPIIAEARYSVHVVPILSVFAASCLWALSAGRATARP